MQIAVKYIPTHKTRLERLVEAYKQSDKLNLVLFVLAVLAITVSMIDWLMVKSFLNALFHGL